MKRVLIYTENYLPGGGNRYFVDIANSIDSDSELFIFSNKNGLFKHDFKHIIRNYDFQEINVLTIPRFYFHIKKLNLLIKIFCFLFVKSFKLPISFLLKLHNIELFNKVIKNINPDIIISCNGGFPGGSTCLDMIYVAKKKSIASILTIVSMPQHKFGFSYKILYKNINIYCDQIIVNSLKIKDEFIKVHLFSENKVKVIYNSIDFKELAYTQANFKLYLEKNFGTKGYKIIGFVGRIEKLKGVYVLIEAFAKVLSDNKNVKLIMVGSGEIEKAKVFAEKFAVKENVIFTGYYEGNIFDVLDSFDIFVFPSLWEGLPYVILEAMAMEKVIIASDVGGIPELIVDGITGILVKPKNSIDLANKINDILKNINKYSHIGYDARKAIEENFSKIKFISEVNKIICQNIK